MLFLSGKKQLKFLLVISPIIPILILLAILKLIGVGQPYIVPLEIVGYQYMGEHFAVSEFYINNSWGGNIVWSKGGGGMVCCIGLPNKWRPGLIADVRWMVADWTSADNDETFNYSKIGWRTFRAIVPVERYEELIQLEAHFFSGGKVRVVAGRLFSESYRKNFDRDLVLAASAATQGEEFPTLFSEEESAKMSRDGNGRSWK